MFNEVFMFYWFDVAKAYETMPKYTSFDYKEGGSYEQNLGTLDINLDFGCDFVHARVITVCMYTLVYLVTNK